MNTIEALQAIRERISTPEKWTKGASARDTEGVVVLADSPAAVCWSLDGAPFRPEVEALSNAWLWFVIQGAVKHRGWWSIGAFNDYPSTTHADVLALLDEVIKRQQAIEELRKISVRNATLDAG